VATLHIATHSALAYNFYYLTTTTQYMANQELPQQFESKGYGDVRIENSLNTKLEVDIVDDFDDAWVRIGLTLPEIEELPFEMDTTVLRVDEVRELADTLEQYADFMEQRKSE